MVSDRWFRGLGALNPLPAYLTLNLKPYTSNPKLQAWNMNLRTLPDSCKLRVLVPLGNLQANIGDLGAKIEVFVLCVLTCHEFASGFAQGFIMFSRSLERLRRFCKRVTYITSSEVVLYMTNC